MKNSEWRAQIANASAVCGELGLPSLERSGSKFEAILCWSGVPTWKQCKSFLNRTNSERKFHHEATVQLFAAELLQAEQTRKVEASECNGSCWASWKTF